MTTTPWLSLCQCATPDPEGNLCLGCGKLISEPVSEHGIPISNMMRFIIGEIGIPATMRLLAHYTDKHLKETQYLLRKIKRTR